MKNKVFTYTLFFLVILLWGYLIYKIFAAVSSEEDMIIPTNQKTTSKKENLQYYTRKDSLSLSFQYADPIFNKNENEIIEEQKDMLEISTDYNVVSEYITPEPELDISYLGFIENEKTKKRIAIIQLEGKQIMIAQNETQNEARILKISNDYVVINYKNNNKTAYK